LGRVRSGRENPRTPDQRCLRAVERAIPSPASGPLARFARQQPEDADPDRARA
jgi:hypothetical protein